MKINRYKLPLAQFLLLIYFLVPHLLFCFYIQPLLLVILLPITIIALSRIDLVTPKQVGFRIITLLFIFSLALLLLSGNAAWLVGAEQGDWYKHNTIINDLIKNDWPVVYENGYALNYYLGYYLPASVIGKIFNSFLAAKVFLSLWTALGIFLGTINIFNLLVSRIEIAKYTKRAALLTICFMLFSGLDWLRFVIQKKKLPALGTHLEWEGSNTLLQYPSLFTALAWAPQHFLPVLAILPLCFQKENRVLAFILTFFSLGWSPFAFVGCLLIWLIFNYKSLSIEFIKDYLKNILLIPALICAPLLFYFSYHVDNTYQISFPIEVNFYFRFIILELITLVACIYFLRERLKPYKYQLISIGILLAVLPLVKIGDQPNNDFVIRLSTPLLAALLLIILSELIQTKERFRFILVILILALGVITPLFETARIMKSKQILEPYPSIIDGEIKDKELYFKQYLGFSWR